MNNKKGFTLIELMVAIVILGLITVLIIPIYNNVTGKTQEKAYRSKVNLIEARAGNYAEEMKNEIKISADTVCVSIETLIKKNYLLSDDAKALFLTNPNPDKSEAGKYMAGVIKLDYINGKITAEYSLDSTVCGVLMTIPDYDDRYVIDLDPPTGTMRINPPSEFTNSTHLSLTLEPDDDAYEFCFNSVESSCLIYRKLSAYDLTNVPYELENTNQGNHTVYVWFRDKHLNTMERAERATIFYDTIPPTCPIVDGANWVTSRTISWGCADLNGSGCNPSSDSGSQIYNTVTTVTANVPTYYISDNAGNTTTCQNIIARVYVDLTKPTCAVSGGNPTWTNGNRMINADCNDTHSGCAIPSLSYNYGANPSETAINTSTAGAVGISSGGRFYDRVGNWIDCSANQTVKIDKILPTCSITANITSWINTDIITTIVGSDTGGSGVSSINSGTGFIAGSTATRTYASNATQNGSVRDVAGNTGTCAYVISNIDKVDPTCAVIGGSTSWTNGSRVVTATCSDAASGCATAPFSTTYSQNIITSSAGALGNGLGGKVFDIAGNSVNCSANQTVKVDITPPSCDWSPGSWGTTTYPSISGSDSGGSGVSQINGGGGWVSGSSTTGSFSSSGTKTGSIRDVAGNESTCTIAIGTRTEYRVRTCGTGSRCSGAGCQTYNSCKDSSCGNDSCRTSGCGCDTRNSCSHSDCGYVTCPHSSCGSNYSAWGSWIGSNCKGAPEGCTETDTNTTQYKCGTIDGCPANSYLYKRTRTWQSYKSCPHSSCGNLSCVNDSCTCATYTYCKHSECGYASCVNSNCTCATYYESCSVCGCDSWNSFGSWGTTAYYDQEYCRDAQDRPTYK